jgi:hypothetical protein
MAKIKCNSHYLIFRTTSDELMACLNISWQRCSVKPQSPSDAGQGWKEHQQASLQSSKPSIPKDSSCPYTV